MQVEQVQMEIAATDNLINGKFWTRLQSQTLSVSTRILIRVFVSISCRDPEF